MGTEQLVEHMIHCVFYASIISIFLPPIEMFDDYPRFQKHYKLVISIIGTWAALNLRGKIASAYRKRKENGDSNA